MKKISILFLILLCNCTFLYAQQFSITGVVTDKKLKEPIIGASVIVKGTTNGTVTDLDGNFTSKFQKKMCWLSLLSDTSHKKLKSMKTKLRITFKCLKTHKRWMRLS